MWSNGASRPVTAPVFGGTSHYRVSPWREAGFPAYSQDCHGVGRPCDRVARSARSQSTTAVFPTRRNAKRLRLDIRPAWPLRYARSSNCSTWFATQSLTTCGL